MSPPPPLTLLLPLLLLLLPAPGARALGDACSEGHEFNLTVRGSRNATGHPVVQADLDQPAGRDPWRFNVEVKAVTCPSTGARSQLTVTLTGPAAASRRQGRMPEAMALVAEGVAAAPADAAFDADDAVPVAQDAPRRRYARYAKEAGVGRYRPHPQRANWTAAARACLADGATLAVPNSQREADALWRLKMSATPVASSGGGVLEMAAASVERNSFFVGASDADAEGTFLTIFGETLAAAGYERWLQGEPNGGAAENCVAMFQNVGLFDTSCDAQLPFLCELPL